MTTVTISKNYKIKLPKEVISNNEIAPGKKFQMFSIGNRIILMPFKDIKESRGFLKGMNTTIERT